MAQKQLNLTVAVKNDAIVGIEDVESGLKCGCVCPACGEPLVAKKGKKMMHHFAHNSGHNCEYGYESSLHLAAKEILSRAQRMTIPAVYVSFPNSYKKDELVYEAQEIEIEKVALERRYDSIIPDVVVYSGGKQFFIEIYVTHCIDDEKLEKLKKTDISTIEIDLSKKCTITSVSELQKLLLGNCVEKKWKYNSVSERFLHKFYRVADRRDPISRGYAIHVDNCPIHIRDWHGKAYANYIDDCLDCKYCVSTSREEGILCTGRQKIATVNDLLPESQRVRKHNEGVSTCLISSLSSGKCPRCGGKLLFREGKNVSYRVCLNAPRCQFMAKVDSADSDVGEIIMK